MINNIKYSKTTETIKDSKSYPIVKVTYLKRIGDVAVGEPYGIHGSAPVGTPCLMYTIGNDESNRMLVPLSSKTRPRDLLENEFVCGNFVVGSTVLFDQEGNIHVTSINDININAGNDINIVASGGDINVTGDIHVTGSIDTTGDIIAGTISVQSHIHSGVQPGGGTSGPPVP